MNPIPLIFDGRIGDFWERLDREIDRRGMGAYATADEVRGIFPVTGFNIDSAIHLLAQGRTVKP